MQITRYANFPDKASYHSAPSLRDAARTFLLSRYHGIRIGRHSKICKNVDIRITKGGILEIGDYSTIIDYTFLQLTMPEPHVKIGNHTVIGRNCIIASKTKIVIGDFVLIGPRVQINDQLHGTNRNDLITNQQAILKPVTIKNDVWIGAGAFIMPGVTIGDGCVVGAGSVVTKSIPEYEIWAGNPARFIRKRE